jgi:hypothetical protein
LSDEDWRRLQKEPCNEYGNSESPCFSAGSSQTWTPEQALVVMALLDDLPRSCLDP